MEDYQARVYQEKVDLDEKIIKLSQFIHSPKMLPLETEARELLRDQLNVMQHYSYALERRIAFFNK